MAAQPQGGPLAVFQGDRFLARKKIFKLLGNAFHIYNPSGNLEFYVEQKAFKLKEAITVYRSEAKQEPALLIQARSVMDFSGIYDVTTPDGQTVGALKREGLKSMLRDEWTILDAGGQEIGKIMEDSMLKAMLRRFLSNLIPESFTVTIGGQEVADFDQHFNPFVAKYDIDFSKDTEHVLDRRLGIAAVVMLLAIEGRQSQYD